MSTLTELEFRASTGTERSITVEHSDSDPDAGVVLMIEDHLGVGGAELNDEHLSRVLAGLTLGLARLRGVVPVDAAPEGGLVLWVAPSGTVAVRTGDGEAPA